MSPVDRFAHAGCELRRVAAIVSVLLSLAVSCGGCATSIAIHGEHRVLLRHALFVDGKGLPAKVVDSDRIPVRSTSATSPDLEFPPALFETRYSPRLAPYARAFADEVAEITQGVRDHAAYCRAKGLKPEVWLIIHGGRNTLTENLDTETHLISTLASERPEVYPILIKYESEDLSSYVEHLVYTRPAHRGHAAKAWRTCMAPLTLVHDVGAGIARVPMNFYNQFSREGTAWRPAPLVIAACADSATFDLPDPSTRVHHGLITFALGLAATVTRSAADAVVATAGPGEWESMKRRAQVMLTLDHSFIPELQAEESQRYCRTDDDNGIPGAVGLLLQSLAQEFDSDDESDATISIFAHSTGAIVACNIFSTAAGSRLPWKDVVFMAAACTIQDFDLKVRPLLVADRTNGGKRTLRPPEFYNLCLHPLRELEEFGYPTAVFVRGTLLVWIDDFLAPVGSYRDRTLGRAENSVPYFGLLARTARVHCHVKVFDYECSPTSGPVPKHHSDFMRPEFCFWRGSFRLPRARRDASTAATAASPERTH